MRALTIAWIAAASLLSGCREIELMHEPPAFEWPSGSPRRLTFNVGDDRNPTWSPGGDSIYYSAQGYPGIPLGRGVLVAAPAEGGKVRAIYAFLHTTLLGPRYSVAPAISPDGSRILFVEITSEAAPAPCVHTEFLTDCPGVAPLLQQAHLVVRGREEASGTEPVIAVVNLPGRASRGFPPPYNDHVYPYHRLYSAGRIAFTASWSPDNATVVFSDGLSLYLWQVGEGEPTPIAGTDYALHPAWSPDGTEIVFMRIRPAAVSSSPCQCDEDGSSRFIIRTVHVPGTPMLELVGPDGTGGRVIGVGEDPTWASDGRLYARTNDGIARIDLDTGAAQPIAGTERGTEPAVSPDGSRLAFTHHPEAGGSDVWVVELSPQ